MQSRSERRWSTRWCGFAHPLPAALRSPRTGPRHASEVRSVVASGGSAWNVRRAEITVDANVGPVSTTTSCPTSTRCAAIWTCDRRGLPQETSPPRSSPLRLLRCIGPPYNTARCRASVQHRAADRFACTSPTTVFHDGGTGWDARYPPVPLETKIDMSRPRRFAWSGRFRQQYRGWALVLCAAAYQSCGS